MNFNLNPVSTISHFCPQGTEAWHQARAGHVTASHFEEVCELAKSGKNKGGYGDTARKYAMRLAIERISKAPLNVDGFNVWQAERGQILEADARRHHSNRTGLLIEPVGFVGTVDGKFGCSADGFIDDDAGAEYKCYLDPTKLHNILIEKDIAAVRFQCQGNMWLTERAWWDFALYCPALAAIGLDLQLFRIERDEAFISDMVPKLHAFDRLVESYQAQLRVEGMRAMAASSDDFPIHVRAPELEAA